MDEKEDKWLLASEMQKAVRRGMGDRAQKAAERLYQVDRAYMAYRLGVIVTEDLLAGGGVRAEWFTQNPWGAKHFTPQKSPEDLDNWRLLIERLSGVIKSSLPCEMNACVWWIQDFEKNNGNWSLLTLDQAQKIATTKDFVWWERALALWRLIGTERFPHEKLPKTQGSLSAWRELAPKNPLVDTIGMKQIEPHIIFLPLAQEYLIKSTIRTTNTEDCSLFGWMDSAVDKHTRDGLKALSLYYRKKIEEGASDLKHATDTLGTLFFWVDGGKLDRSLTSPEEQKVIQDIRGRWLSSRGISGQDFFKTWYDPNLLKKCKERCLSETKWAQTPHTTQTNQMKPIN